MKILICLSMLVSLSFFTGCADIGAPTPEEIVRDPFGRGGSMLQLGMSKEQVRSIYGEADAVREVCCGPWAGNRDEWFYKARYEVLPMAGGLLHKDIYLYFDDNSLTNISRDPIGSGLHDDPETEGERLDEQIQVK